MCLIISGLQIIFTFDVFFLLTALVELKYCRILAMSFSDNVL